MSTYTYKLTFAGNKVIKKTMTAENPRAVWHVACRDADAQTREVRSIVVEKVA